ncbi:MAG: TetR/AcrR family transcriptional regulator [Prevotellaceae bacterium]|jgi:AcrR family transcriptional regulator|nr:TetR/AcrR family transcriptional regulator [Prevotellaceae bacterium]
MPANNHTATEQAILKAAEEVFLSKGFIMAKTADIAKLAGVNQALLHYYFRTKENLFEAVFAQKIKHLMSIIYDVLGSDIPLMEKIKVQVETQFDFLLSNPKLPFVVISEIARVPQRTESFRAMVSQQVTKIIEKLQAELDEAHSEGKIRKTSALDLMISAISQNVFLFLAHPIFQALTNMSDEDFEKFVAHRKQENVAFILNSLRPEELRVEN